MQARQTLYLWATSSVLCVCTGASVCVCKHMYVFKDQRRALTIIPQIPSTVPFSSPPPSSSSSSSSFSSFVALVSLIGLKLDKYTSPAHDHQESSCLFLEVLGLQVWATALKKIIIKFYVYWCLVCTYIYITCARRPEEASDPLGLVSQVVVSLQMCVRNWTKVF